MLNDVIDCLRTQSTSTKEDRERFRSVLNALPLDKLVAIFNDKRFVLDGKFAEILKVVMANKINKEKKGRAMSNMARKLRLKGYLPSR